MSEVQLWRYTYDGMAYAAPSNTQSRWVSLHDFKKTESQLDAQRLRADAAEAELKREKEFHAVNVSESERILAAAEQRIAELEAALTEITPWAKGVGSKALKSRIYSMLNIKSCEKCLGAGFIGFENTELRSLNGGAWGRCLACRPFTIDAALNQKSEGESQ